MFVPHLAVDVFNLGLRLCDRRPGRQSSDDGIASRIASLHLRITKRQRSPNFGPLAKLSATSDVKKLEGKIEIRRHDSDDGETFAV